MGLFGFIKNAVASPRKISVDISLGNVLVAGNSDASVETIARNYVIDSANKGVGVIAFRDRQCAFSAYPSAASSPSAVYGVDCSGRSRKGQIDIFAGRTDAEASALAVRLFDMLNEIPKADRMNYQNYILMILQLARKAGRKVSLDKFVDYPIEDMDDLNMTYASGSEQSRNDRFLNSVRPDISKLESYFADFASNAAGFALSGSKSLEQVIRSAPVVEFSFDFAGRLEESSLIIAAIIDAVSRFDYVSSGSDSLSIVSIGVPNDALASSGLNRVFSLDGCRLFCAVKDISNLVKQSNEWIDCSDSFFFLNQKSNDNKAFCSEFFGEFEKKKVTVTKSKNGPLFNTTRGSSRTVDTVKEQVYPPEKFAGLSDREAIYYFRKNNSHGYVAL